MTNLRDRIAFKVSRRLCKRVISCDDGPPFRIQSFLEKKFSASASTSGHAMIGLKTVRRVVEQIAILDPREQDLKTTDDGPRVIVADEHAEDPCNSCKSYRVQFLVPGSGRVRSSFEHILRIIVDESMQRRACLSFNSIGLTPNTRMAFADGWALEEMIDVGKVTTAS